MNIEGIIAISGKGGLFKLLSQSRGGFIVESLADGKRFPVHSTNNVSSLEDIAMYTYEEEVPLREVFSNIAKKENEGPTLSHKESAKVLKEYFAEVLPNFDEERVYSSDIKKVFQWYNILHAAGLVAVINEEEDTIEDADVISEE
ncbi:MAG: DUF5606 domain-containing protein [Bacteroidota bacterium]